MAMHFLRKTTCWTTVFLCILFISRVPVALGSQSPETIPGTDQRVKVTAGWYGTKHHKKLTANGKKFNMHKNTLAHRTLPFGTRVRLVSLDNKKFAEGVVNDRGPYSKGRDLDVSYSMAQQLGFVQKGVVQLYLSQLEDQDPQN
jgi:rare lipoprotein A (peptidoglycan hydrolase)